MSRLLSWQEVPVAGWLEKKVTPPSTRPGGIGARSSQSGSKKLHPMPALFCLLSRFVHPKPRRQGGRN